MRKSNNLSSDTPEGRGSSGDKGGNLSVFSVTTSLYLVDRK
jgi:hypothetical protein